MLIRYLHSPDDGQPDGAESGDVKASDIINRYGNTADSALRLAEKVADLENRLYRMRRTRDTLTQERDDLKAKLPADGAVVVAKDDAAQLEQYRALGAPAALKQALDAKAEIETQLTMLRRDATLRDVQAATGFDRDVLSEIGAGWEYRIDATADAPVVYVKDGDQEVRIDEHPKVKKFLPALKPSSAGTHAPDIDAGARNAGGGLLTEQDRERASARYRATF